MYKEGIMNALNVLWLLDLTYQQKILVKAEPLIIPDSNFTDVFFYK